MTKEGDWQGPGRSQNVQDMRSSESYKIIKVPLQIAIGSEQQLREKTLISSQGSCLRALE